MTATHKQVTLTVKKPQEVAMTARPEILIALLAVLIAIASA